MEDTMPQERAAESDRISVAIPPTNRRGVALDLPARQLSGQVDGADRQEYKRMENKRFLKSLRDAKTPGGPPVKTLAVLEGRFVAHDDELRAVAYENCEAHEAPMMYDEHGSVINGSEAAGNATFEDAYMDDGEENVPSTSPKSRLGVFSKSRSVEHNRNDSKQDEAQTAEQASACAGDRFFIAGLANGLTGLRFGKQRVSEDAHMDDGEENVPSTSPKSRLGVFSKSRSVGHNRNDSKQDEAQTAEQASARARDRFAIAGLANGLKGLRFGKQCVSEAGNDADDEAEPNDEEGERAVTGPSKPPAFTVRDFALELTSMLDHEMRFRDDGQESQCREFMDSYSEGQKHLEYVRAIARQPGPFELMDDVPEVDRGRARTRTGRRLVFGDISAEQQADVLSWWVGLDIEQL